MTYLELIAAVGSAPMDMARMYFNGGLTQKELKNVIGRKKAGLVEHFYIEKNLENNACHAISKVSPCQGCNAGGGT